MANKPNKWPPYVGRLERLKLALDQYTIKPDKSLHFKDPSVNSVVPLLNDIVKIMGREVYMNELWDKKALIKEVEHGKKEKR